MNVYPHDVIVPFKNSSESKKKQIADMFDKIAFRYDFLNRFLSVRTDIGWRRKAIGQLVSIQPKEILDVATGTGDFALMSYKILKPEKIIGIDISEGMLEIGRKKMSLAGIGNNIELINGDSEAILFEDNSFDAVTVAFGVRNFEHLEKGLSEIKRVLRPGGKLVVLECTKPSLPVIKQLYHFYMKFVTPKIGKIIAKNNEAYKYLKDSIIQFPEKESFIHILNGAKYRNTFYKTLTLGICTIYCAEK